TLVLVTPIYALILLDLISTQQNISPCFVSRISPKFVFSLSNASLTSPPTCFGLSRDLLNFSTLPHEKKF
ncbi:hypothetical protein ACEWGJ_12470, partial [Vibrio diabolicus]|uniref:hypothetical protein n=1 Tax=Vibrio diabolicus TaxID=50719 RepID=UPI0035A831CD